MTTQTIPSEKKKGGFFANFKLPSAYTILFILIAFVALLTWIIPAGQYDRAMNEELGREVPVTGTYQAVEGNPQGVIDVLLAPIDGFYDHNSYEAAAIDVSLFILIIGGFLGLVTKTGAIDAGIERVTARLEGREELMIPILMALFAAGGTVYGMAEESLPFYTLLVPVMMAVRFDPLVAAATVLLGSGIGVLGSSINPFATVRPCWRAHIIVNFDLSMPYFIIAIYLRSQFKNLALQIQRTQTSSLQKADLSVNQLC